MNFISKLERKFGKYAIPNLGTYIIIMYAIGFVLQMIGYSGFMMLNPYSILHGQIWRLVTFVLLPPSTNLIFLFFTLYFYYMICKSLENVWGAFRFNLYYFTGVLLTILASFVVYFVTGSPFVTMGTYYLNLSLFLAFAACFPDMQVLLYMIVPIKIKWLAYLDAAYLLYMFIVSPLSTRVEIIVALLNFLLFFFASRNFKRISPREIHRRQTFKRETRQPSKETRHQCVVCHRTEKDDPNLEFRFCSKCEGNYEYCQDHLFTHTHIKKS